MRARLLGCCCGLAVSLALTAIHTHDAAAAPDCAGRGDSSYAPTSGPLFNDPDGSDAEEYLILSTIKRHIDNTPPGEVVRVATLRMGWRPIVTSLIEADDCGVDVRVVVNEGSWNDPMVVTLRGALGTMTSRGSYVTRCDGACLDRGAEGIMHAKLYLFSRTGGVGKVAMHSSTNLTEGQAEGRFNDAYQTTRDRAAFGAAKKYFDALDRDGDVAFPRMASTPGHRHYFFPQLRSFHLQMLDDTRCRSATGPTSIELSVSIWTSVAVARKLAELAHAGCAVRVVLHRDEADRRVLRILHRRRVPTRVQSAGWGRPATHSKYFAIDGWHRGRAVQTVYCGSLNVNRQSYESNNTMIRIVDDAAVYSVYHDHFKTLWHGAQTLTRSDVRAAGRLNAWRAERRD